MARFALNANGWQGWIDIEIGQDTCTGHMQFNFSPTGEAADQSADISNGTVDRTVPGRGHMRSTIVDFDRGTQGQHYRGWLSDDGRVIAGYFTRSDIGYQKGWYATIFA